MKKNKGITLIALIITIIIMLILVAVSVSILINSGLIGKAKDGAQKTKSAYEQEQRLGESINIEGVMYNSIDEIVGGTELHSWTRSGDTLTCSHCNTTLTIGQTVNYTAGGTGEASITANKSGLDKAAEDYPQDFTAETQTIRRDANTVWVVLGREDSNSDGNYETLLLTTQNPTEDTIILYGAAAYNNWVSECNRMAQDLYGSNARGMTIEDVNRCLQYTPTGGMYWDSSNNCQTTRDFTTKLKDLSIWSSFKTNGTYTPDGTNTEAKLGNYELNGYWYRIDGENMYITDDVDPSNTSHAVTAEEKRLIFGNTSDYYYYWLASRGVSADSDNAVFGPGRVNNGGAGSCDGFFYSIGDGNCDAFGFRAVVFLTSNIPTIQVMQ